jgi:hypothetical protein
LSARANARRTRAVAIDEGLIMATAATARMEPARANPVPESRFFATLAIVMAVVVVAGFATQFAMGRSTFASPLRVHLHAVAFMGWVALFVAQSQFAARGTMQLHRRLGWFALGWMALMAIAALWVIAAMARNGTVPFFFVPQQFIVTDPLIVVTFVGLTGWAIALRRRTEWHARLHICAMAALTAPAFGRLLPMPLLVPYAFEAAVVAGLVFPLAGMIHDLRRRGAIHPAWIYGAGVVLASVPVGAPGASVDPLAFGAPPAGPLTGR